MSSEEQEVRERFGWMHTATDLASARRIFDQLGESLGMPDGVTVKPTLAPSCPAEWIDADGAGGTVVLYLHGGGYVSGSLRSHRHLAAQIAKSLNGRVLQLDYRLGPDHLFPAALDDALDAYRHLLDQGIHPKRVVLMGDSAGGNLVIATMLAARDADLPLPACGVCFSPWIDAEANGASVQSKASVDPAFTREVMLHAGSVYFAGADSSNPLAAVLKADLNGLPPLLIQVGSHEMLLDDATRLASLAAHHDVETTLEVLPRMVHIFPYFYPILRQGREAIERVSVFVARHVSLGD